MVDVRYLKVGWWFDLRGVTWKTGSPLILTWLNEFVASCCLYELCWQEYSVHTLVQYHSSIWSSINNKKTIYITFLDTTGRGIYCAPLSSGHVQVAKLNREALYGGLSRWVVGLFLRTKVTSARTGHNQLSPTWHTNPPTVTGKSITRC